jgi:hypothetical protein
VNSVDDIPIVSNGLSDVYLNEDFKQNWSVNLDDVFTDIDGELEYAAQLLDTSIVELVLSLNTLSLIAIDDQNGETNLIVTATNPTRESVSDTVLVSIQAINDAPIMDAISDTIINEDQEVVLQLSGSDIDGDELSFVVEPVEHVNSYISGNGTMLNLIPEQDWFGEAQVVVNVLDGSGLTDSTVFALIVLSVDDDPIQDGYLADMDFNEDFEDPWVINLDEIFTDIDGDLSFTTSLSVPDVIGIDLTEGLLSFYALEDAFGETEMIVTASNMMRTSVSDTLMITVHTINDAPVLSAIPNIEIDEDQMVTLALDGNDADGDSIYYSIDLIDQIESIISPEGDELIITPNENWFGLSEITVTLHDGSGLMDTETFSLIVNPINDAPSFHFIDSLTANEGTDITFLSMTDLYNSGLVVDVDDSLEALEFSLTLLDLPFTINWDGGLESIPVLENIAPSFSGPGGLIVNVSDGIYLVHDTIPVMVYNINTPAVVLEMDTISIDEDDVISIMSMEALYNNGIISDIDNNFNELSFSLEINSDEIQIEWDGAIGSTPLIIPDPNVFGDYILTLCVNDGDNNSCADNALVVNPINDAPFISVAERIYINEGENLSLTSMEALYNSEDLSDIDTDFEDLTYTYNPTDLPFTVEWDGNANSEPLLIQNNSDYVGSGIMESCVSDGESTVCDSSLITILPVNDPPYISSLDTIFMVEDELFMLQSLDDMGENEYFMDPDNDIADLTYAITISGAPIEISWDGNMGSEIQLSSNELNFNGEGLLNLCISDGEFEVCGSAVIHVQAVNDAPYFISELDEHLGLNVEFNIPIIIGDVDSEILEITLVDGAEYPDWFNLEDNVIMGAPNSIGQFEFPIILSDGELHIENTLQIEVHNFIPEITNIMDVPEDQGGRVYLSFNASYFDNEEDSDQMYSVFRYDDFGNDSSGWVGVQTMVAAGEESYTYEIQTALDSTSEDNGMTDFKVVASMTGGVFHSEMMSGYSVDNIAPGIPQGFMASAADDGIQLSWEAVQDSDFQYYVLEKALDTYFTNPELIMTTDSVYVDTLFEYDQTFYYRLAALDYAGNQGLYTGWVEATVQLALDENLIPAEFALHQNYPNPFNPLTQIKYDLPEDAVVTINIFDLMGRNIKSLISSSQSAGYHSIKWDATNNYGETVSAGMYLYIIQAGEFRQTKKMLLLK